MSITPYIPPAYISSLPSGIWSGTQGLPVFPYLPGMAVSVSKQQEWSTLTPESASGRETRTPMWASPRWQFEVSYDVLAISSKRVSSSELAIMWEFFGVLQGSYAPFLLVDPTDCQIGSGSPVNFGTGNGSTKTFQLSRTINSFSEPVYDVYSPTILDNGSAAGAHSFSPNGQITFTTAPANGHALTWYGYFYFGCRFLEDTLSFQQIVNMLWEGKSLKFKSLIP